MTDDIDTPEALAESAKREAMASDYLRKREAPWCSRCGREVKRCGRDAVACLCSECTAYLASVGGHRERPKAQHGGKRRNSGRRSQGP